jgi:hypothetical protein
MFLKPVYQGSHTVVPELDGRRVQGDENPWALAVEGDALCPGGLGLELLSRSEGRGEAAISMKLTLVNMLGDCMLAVSHGAVELSDGSCRNSSRSWTGDVDAAPAASRCFGGM